MAGRPLRRGPRNQGTRMTRKHEEFCPGARSITFKKIRGRKTGQQAAARATDPEMEKMTAELAKVPLDSDKRSDKMPENFFPHRKRAKQPAIPIKSKAGKNDCRVC